MTELVQQRRAGGSPMQHPWLLRRTRYLAALGREMVKIEQYFGRRV